MIGEAWLALAPPISRGGHLVMVAWACKGGEGRWRPLSDRGFESSVMIGVTAGACLALAPPISPV